MAEDEPQPQKTKSNSNRATAIKAALFATIVLLLEAGTIGVTMYLSGGPAAAKGEQTSQGDQASQDGPAEVLVVEDRFPNTRSGRQYLYDTEVYITVEGKHADTIKKKLESMRAQIEMAIGVTIRKADPSYFKEATLATLRRQIKAELDKRLGSPPEGESYIEEVLITKMIPFRSDF